MNTSKKLSKKQLAVLDDLFKGDLEAPAILQKNNLSADRFNKWLADENFKNQFTQRIEWLNLQSQAMIARYASIAVTKLVNLADSEKGETARKACLDIISLPKIPVQNKQQKGDLQQQKTQELPPALASKLLQALAE